MSAEPPAKRRRSSRLAPAGLFPNNCVIGGVPTASLAAAFLTGTCARNERASGRPRMASALDCTGSGSSSVGWLDHADHELLMMIAKHLLGMSDRKLPPFTLRLAVVRCEVPLLF